MISIHASRGGSDWKEVTNADVAYYISIHASRGGSDSKIGLSSLQIDDFNPRFPRGKRHLHGGRYPCPVHFNPRFPRGKRQALVTAIKDNKSDFNPRFPRGKRPMCMCPIITRIIISIHASRGGSDHRQQVMQHSRKEFQSTLPAGEATWHKVIFRIIKDDFNPRFPRGKRLLFVFEFSGFFSISIHASRGGSDCISGRGT